MLAEMYALTSLAFLLVYVWLRAERRKIRFLFLGIYGLLFPVAVVSGMYWATLGLQIVMIAFIGVWYYGYEPDGDY